MGCWFSSSGGKDKTHGSPYPSHSTGQSRSYPKSEPAPDITVQKPKNEGQDSKSRNGLEAKIVPRPSIVESDTANGENNRVTTDGAGNVYNPESRLESQQLEPESQAKDAIVADEPQDHTNDGE